MTDKSDLSLKIPNFFIVGATKCGTTSLFEYLSTHPNIFMSPIKEPSYFNPKFSPQLHVRSLDEYMNLFSKRTLNQTAVGEATPLYLFYSSAIEKIRDFNSEAKIIVMIRNPVEMAKSLHHWYLTFSMESEPDFEKAWRNHGSNINELGQARPGLPAYQEACLLGRQTQRLLEYFPPHQVKVILLDDFRDSPKEAYESVLEFLSVPSDGRTDFPSTQEAFTPKNEWLFKMIFKPPRGIKRLVHLLHRIKYALGIKPTTLHKLYRNKVEKKPISPTFEAELYDYFAEDIKLLSKIIKRDLSHWFLQNKSR